MPSPELKPCPFCGRPAEIMRHTYFDKPVYTVGCHINQRNLCHATVRATIIYDSPEAAVAAWNRRAGEDEK